MNLETLDTTKTTNLNTLTSTLVDWATKAGYIVIERNDTKPWGAYLRLDAAGNGMFIKEFFSNLSIDDLKTNQQSTELGIKFLIISPHQRLSWQYHDRRAEWWLFLTPGAYVRSDSNEQTESCQTVVGEVVQIRRGVRHRLIGGDNFTIVAEIWQHTDPMNLSDESDIVRLSDDYNR